MTASASGAASRPPRRRAAAPEPGADAPQPAARPPVQAWLRLLRWKNLLIVAATQFLAWICLIWPLRSAQALVLQPGIFACLVASTVCIAGAGYLINDYFDIKIDAINRPRTAVLENPVRRRRALLAHGLLNGAGLLLAAVVAVRAGQPLRLLWQAGTVLLLWLYSTHFKRMFLVGNVVVALLTGLSVALLPLFEPAVLVAGGPLSPAAVLWAFAGFAFLLTWMREIVKDAEDRKGDAAEGCDTMPIRWGLLRAMRFTQGIGAVTLIAVAAAAGVLFRAGLWPPAGWLVFGIGLPLASWLLHLPRLTQRAQYARASRTLKLLMLSGLIALILLHLVLW